jgi:hypothetical protein
MRKFLLNHKLVTTLALWTILISIPPSNAFAMPSASVTAFDIVSLRQAQMNKIMSELSRPEARTHLMLMGISQNELKAKLTQLDDAQLASVAKKADAVKVAGDAGLGIIITLLVIAILAIIFVRLANNKKIVA